MVELELFHDFGRRVNAGIVEEYLIHLRARGEVRGGVAHGVGDTGRHVRLQKVVDKAQRVLAMLLAELPLKTAVKLTADITGAPRNTLYNAALALRKSAS